MKKSVCILLDRDDYGVARMEYDQKVALVDYFQSLNDSSIRNFCYSLDVDTAKKLHIALADYHAFDGSSNADAFSS